MSVLQRGYELERREKECLRVKREAKLELWLLTAMRSLIHVRINNASADITLCSEGGLTIVKTLYCLLKRLHKLQKSGISNAYSAVRDYDNVSDLTYNLLSKCGWKHKKVFDV